ncbi:MAG: aminotransferase class IV [Deltaproteobacteria bacterium]|nr:aminotransferase class IV [Deltaproteobacteria bacterium]
MKKQVYMNGSIVPENRAAVSVFDRGLNYGDGLFETMKAAGGKVEFLKDHLSRLKKGLSLLGFPAGSLKALEHDIKDGAVQRLLKANGLQVKTAYLRVTVTRGTDPDGHLPKKSGPTVIMAARPIDTDYISRLRTHGVSAISLRGYCPVLPGIKSLNYLPSVLGKAEAVRSGAVEGIFIGPDSSIREGTSSNIFVVSGGVLLTPPVSSDTAEGVLPGVMRKAVIRLAIKKGVSVREARVCAKDLRSCSEAFLTNSIWGVVPLISVDKKKVGSGRPGEVARLMQSAL